MGDVVELDSRRPHVKMLATDGTIHVIPLVTLEKIAKGELCITQLDDWQKLVPSIVEDWIDCLPIEG